MRLMRRSLILLQALQVELFKMEGIIGNANGEESVDELKKRVSELTKQLEAERNDRIIYTNYVDEFIEMTTELETRHNNLKVHIQRIEQRHQSALMVQPPPVETPAIDRAVRDPSNIIQPVNSNSVDSSTQTLESVDPSNILQSSDSNSVDSSTQTLESDFGVSNTTLPIENPMNELSSNDMNALEENVHSDMMGDDMNFMDEPITGGLNSTLIDENSLNNLSSIGENMDDTVRTEMIGESIDSIDEEYANDTTVHHTTNTKKDPSESGEVKKMRVASRVQSRSMESNDSQYGRVKRPRSQSETDDELEPLEKKSRMDSEEKKIGDKARSRIGDSPSNSSTKCLLVTKINHLELECPNCAYRSRSVAAWIQHLKNTHSTTPLQLNLALLCECGIESFSGKHSLKCEISKITVVRKNPTPKCVMCEMYPKTPSGYAIHFYKHHKMTLKQKGIFLICSCGFEVRGVVADREHLKKCNGHEYSLHKVDEE